MKIGFVSTWGEVGAGYVTKNYIDIMKKNDVYVYPRGVKKKYKKNSVWDMENVANTPDLATTNINWRHFKNWIVENDLEIIFFNEQVNILPVLKVKKHCPNVKVGTYVDYYTKDSINEFKWFDFIICNTKRHYSVFKELHDQVYYVKWGVDVDLFTEHRMKKNGLITFFHSSGWAHRKGTDIILDTFMEKKFYKRSNLLIHTQTSLELDFDYTQYNIDIVNETISHPGLYHMGDVYLYPTRLEGLGLTMYEALVSGLPIVVPDDAPMNELVSGENGKLLSVDKYIARSDGYYWPTCEPNREDLANAMEYYILLGQDLYELKKRVRNNAIKTFNWADRQKVVSDIFHETKTKKYSNDEIDNEIKRVKRKYFKKLGKSILELTDNKYIHSIGRSQI